MVDYIFDSSRLHWMVSNPKRLIRTGMDGKAFRCPFCSGNEADTPPETYRVGEGEADKQGWQIRVVPNMFPITEIHEVVIHSPSHEKQLDEFTTEEMAKIFNVFINRFNFWKEKGKVFIFSNQSLISGASLLHPHTQIAVVPEEIPTNTLAFQPVVNIVEQNDSFVSYCPDYSEWAYEIWITKNLNKEKNEPVISFENMKDKEVNNLSVIFLSAIKKLKKIHGENPNYSKKPFGYNFYIFIPQRSQNQNTSGLEWYLRIIPRFMERAGFELSTGIMVNSVEAKTASEQLKAK